MVATLGLLLEASHDDGHERLLERGSQREERLRVLVDDADADLGHRLAVERKLAAEQLVQDDAERPDVAADLRGARGAHLLGRHVERRADDRRRVGERHLPDRARAKDLGDAEIEDLQQRRSVQAARDEEILRLEIAMHDPGGMRLDERLARLEDVLDGVGDGQRALLLAQLREVHALEELEDHERAILGVAADVVDARDMLALETDRGARLAHEALDVALAGQGMRQDELQRDGLVEIDVPCRNDDAHAAGPEHALDTVLAGDDVAGSHGRFHATRVRHEAGRA